ncbi:hypothetical protein GMI70_05965 [Eggerthellaceae bacterium zg-893]|nr:hypothetical protein [Eggerthellaceae bacterium zg-893]
MLQVVCRRSKRFGNGIGNGWKTGGAFLAQAAARRYNGFSKATEQHGGAAVRSGALTRKRSAL